MNESLTVRISRSAHATLRSLADETDQSMTEILDKAIEAYRRATFLAGLNEDFAALRQNRAAWEEEQQEREHGTPRSPTASRTNFRWATRSRFVVKFGTST